MAKKVTKEDVAGFGLENFLGDTGLGQEVKLSAEELRKQLADDVQKELLRRAKLRKENDGRGRPKGENADEYTKMTFVVNIRQLEKIREIGYQDSRFTKDILEEALANYITKYERANGEIIPRGKSVFKKEDK